MNQQTLTEADLNKMTSSALATLHNQHAKAAGVPLVKRFATKPQAIRRTWAVVELVQERAAKAAPAPAGAKAKAKAAPTAAPSRDDKRIRAGKAPDGRPGVMHAIHDIATKLGTRAREELVAKVLAEYTPPRSAQYDRAYVLGYVAFGLRQGFLKEA